MIVADQRWVGAHGIGRFAREVLGGIEHARVALANNPASPLDPLRLSWALRGLSRSDLFFSPGYNSPLLSTAPFVFTIHDLNHIDRPENTSPAKRAYYSLVLRRACHRAEKILTVSEFSRSRIIEWSGVPSDKVIKVGCGVGPEYYPGLVADRFPFPYLLCVSNRKLHKNEFRQFDAFARSGLAGSIKLVFTGNPTTELIQAIQRAGIEDAVHFAGFTPDGQLPSLYRGARALVFASLYEGFGLPVLEAMACGVPVVTSNTTALAEIAGKAAITVDPEQVDEIAEALRRITHDENLRARLTAAGLQRASLFTWKRTIRCVRSNLGLDHADAL